MEQTLRAKIKIFFRSENLKKQLTLPYVLYVKSAVSLKWSVGFENDMKIAPIFTITFSSKILIKQCFTSLEHTFLDDGLNSL